MAAFLYRVLDQKLLLVESLRISKPSMVSWRCAFLPLIIIIIIKRHFPF